MVKMKETTDNECGIYYTVKPLYKNTSEFYQLLVVNDDPDVCLLNEKYTILIIITLLINLIWRKLFIAECMGCRNIHVHRIKIYRYFT